MVEVRFRPALVGTVADGAITNVKIAALAGIEKSKLASLEIVNADIATGAAITKAKLESLAIVDADISAVSQSKVTDLTTALGNKIEGTGTTGDKKVLKLGWDSATGEVIVDHEA